MRSKGKTKKKKKNNKKVPERNSKKTSNQTKKDEDDDEEEEEEVVSVKCKLSSIILPKYRDTVIAILRDRSIQATKMCVLGSLLFLKKVQEAFDANNMQFFSQDGKQIIQQCFRAVLNQNFYTQNNDPEFRTFIQNLPDEQTFEIPTNRYFGNATNDLIDQYQTNVQNNLNTHARKRLKQYLELRVFMNNQQEGRFTTYNDEDIKHTLNWAINQLDTIVIQTDADLMKRHRREDLLQLVHDLTVFDIPNDDIAKFTKDNWFQSIPLWIAMQRRINRFNLERQREYIVQQQQQQAQAQQQEQPQAQQPQQQQQQQAPIVNGNPWKSFKNLKVIPICCTQRKHVSMDTYTLYNLMCEMGIIERRNGRQIPYNSEFTQNRERHWRKIFKMKHIRHIVRKKKRFDYRILSDGVSVSIQFMMKRKFKLQDMDAIRAKYIDGGFDVALGVDPNMKTHTAVVRRHLDTGKEVNIKISSKRFHWNAKQRIRKAKARRLTHQYTNVENNDLNNRHLYPETPSPLGEHWYHYIEHRLRMLRQSMDVYATDQYARLSLDRHIETNRTIDVMCKKLVDYKSAIVFFGSGSTPPNSPIRIRKHIRAPGPRKMIGGFRKSRNVCVIPTNERYTSQTCALCYSKFDRRTYSHRFKVCQNCRPDPSVLLLPPIIVTQMGKRDLRAFRKLDREHNAANNLPNAGNLLSKVVVYRKNWRVNPAVDGELNAVAESVKKTVWHRDIVAAKCIMIKGFCYLFGLPLNPAFLDPDPQQQQQQQQQDPPPQHQ